MIANLDSILKTRDISLLRKALIVKAMVFPVVMEWIWELNYKEGWASKNWCFQNVVLEKTLESPLDSKEIKPVNPKGNLPWLFIGRTDAEAPILWSPDEKSQLIGKDPYAGKDWGQEGKGATEDEMVGWRRQLNRQESEPILGDSARQINLAFCSPWGHKESDTAEWLNWTELTFLVCEMSAVMP